MSAPQQQKKASNPYYSIQRQPAQNASGSATIPAFGLVRCIGSGPGGVLTVDQPNTDGQSVYVNGPTSIPPHSYGVVSKAWPIWAAYTGTAPAIGQTWGAAAGSYLLTSGKSGFLIETAPNTTAKIVLVSATTSSAQVFSGAFYSNPMSTTTIVPTVSATTLNTATMAAVYDTDSYGALPTAPATGYYQALFQAVFGTYGLTATWQDGLQLQSGAFLGAYQPSVITNTDNNAFYHVTLQLAWQGQMSIGDQLVLQAIQNSPISLVVTPLFTSITRLG